MSLPTGDEISYPTKKCKPGISNTKLIVSYPELNEVYFRTITINKAVVVNDTGLRERILIKQNNHGGDKN